MARSKRPLLLTLLVLLGASPSLAGNLVLYDTSTLPYIPAMIPTPADNSPLDIDYIPVSAEGGGFYGFSELRIEATGDVILTPTGFACQAYSCLYSPQPFVAGRSITITAGNDLTGEFSGLPDLLTFSVSGNQGYVVITGGEYIDATGAGHTVGAIRSVETTVLAAVPEPGLGITLALGFLALAALRRRPQHSL